MKSKPIHNSADLDPASSKSIEKFWRSKFRLDRHLATGAKAPDFLIEEIQSSICDLESLDGVPESVDLEVRMVQSWMENREKFEPLTAKEILRAQEISHNSALLRHSKQTVRDQGCAHESTFQESLYHGHPEDHADWWPADQYPSWGKLHLLSLGLDSRSFGGTVHPSAFNWIATDGTGSRRTAVRGTFRTVIRPQSAGHWIKISSRGWMHGAGSGYRSARLEDASLRVDRALQVVNFGAGAPPQLMVSTTRGHHASFHYPGYGARPEFEVGPLGPNDELSILSKVMVPADIVIFESMTFTAQVEGNDRLVVEAFGGNFSPVCWEMFDL